MVIGNGMLATKFSAYLNCSEYLIFASGVSNSKENRLSEFEREFELLKKNIQEHAGLHLVYFSTCSMYDPVERFSEYVLHKIKIENYIKSHVQSYNIFRISQIIAKAKNQTLINFLIEHIENNQEFDVWKMATRNLVAIEDVCSIVNYILQNKLLKNKAITIANQYNIAVFELIKILESKLGRKAKMVILNKGKPYDKISIRDIKPILKILKINFDKNYYEQAINKLLA